MLRLLQKDRAQFPTGLLVAALLVPEPGQLDPPCNWVGLGLQGGTVTGQRLFRLVEDGLNLGPDVQILRSGQWIFREQPERALENARPLPVTSGSKFNAAANKMLRVSARTCSSNSSAPARIAISCKIGVRQQSDNSRLWRQSFQV